MKTLVQISIYLLLDIIFILSTVNFLSPYKPWMKTLYPTLLFLIPLTLTSALNFLLIKMGWKKFILFQIILIFILARFANLAFGVVLL